MEWLAKFVDWDWDNRNGYRFILSKAITKLSEIPIKTPWAFSKELGKKRYRIHLETLKTPNKEILVDGKEWRWQLTIPYEDTAESRWAGILLPREQRCRRGNWAEDPGISANTSSSHPIPSDMTAMSWRQKSMFKVLPEKVKWGWTSRRLKLDLTLSWGQNPMIQIPKP